MGDTRFRNAFLVLLVVVASATLLSMVRAFLLTIVLAALFTGVVYPAYLRVLRLFRGRDNLAAAATLAMLLVVVVVPLSFVAGAVATEAQRVNDTILPRLQRLVNQPGEFTERLRALPGYSYIAPYRTEVMTKAGELVGTAGGFIFDAVSATTVATAVFIFQFVILLYTMFFFLTDGPGMLKTVLKYLPLAPAETEHLIERFVSVTRATLKGTLLIGVVQGTLGGIAFWAVGIEGAIFWGTVMTVLSTLPGVGSALIWGPAAIILFFMGQPWHGAGLALFGTFVIGAVDNILRPVLVGRDTQMHQLMIMFSTLGGLLVFGAMGFIVGPILAALFVTVWEMFGEVFRGEWGGTEPKAAERAEGPPAA